MSVGFDPCEIFLLSRYASLEYFGEMRDAYAGCVHAAEEALEFAMRNLPRNYRSQPVNAQVDVVWGGLVIPNLQAVLGGLNSAYIAISHGDVVAIARASGVSGAFAAIARDYSSDWMRASYRGRYEMGCHKSWLMASNVYHTYFCTWTPGVLSWNYRADCRGPLEPPDSWPVYRPNPQVRVKTGDKIVVSGVYLPAEAGCAQFLIAGQEALGALPPDDPNDLRTTDERAIPTTWTLVEKIADSGGGIPGASDPWLAGIRERCVAGEACPRTGWWTTPAAPARRRFVAGTVMPELGGDWGTTVWQLDQPD
ncbi:hypothetical protein LOC51_27185 [Rubrivivax sp. JA1024]|uniref:hypothetical protein n=1 Tax=Rubrivivax sp. JA1026 TaxID=2710888 RepID=UPI001E56F4DB|nr:hypothetical protein [Rubrivivax sp. JA1026]MCD0420917.1 hypothetical protein [Rubrivivax sp. JA1024]